MGRQRACVTEAWDRKKGDNSKRTSVHDVKEATAKPRQLKELQTEQERKIGSFSRVCNSKKIEKLFASTLNRKLLVLDVCLV